jgi:uncharacterized protein YjiS (DUF1127 family)
MLISLRRRLAQTFAKLAAIRHAVGGRRALARMDGRMLADIGISRCEAAQEINRKPWDTSPQEHGQ